MTSGNRHKIPTHSRLSTSTYNNQRAVVSMLRPLLLPLKHPLRPFRPTPRSLRPSLLHHVRLQSTLPPVPASDPIQTNAADEGSRTPASLYISNVFPIMLARFDIRPNLAFFREEAMMERLHDIASDISGHAFRVESWEIARKDGGVFLHFSYIPPEEKVDEVSRVEAEMSVFNALPEMGAKKTSPARLFIPQFVASAKKHGGTPHWLGEWGQPRLIEHSLASGHTLYERGLSKPGVTYVGASPEAGEGTSVLGTGSGLKGLQELAGNGRVWLVKGRQWTEVGRPHCQGAAC